MREEEEDSGRMYVVEAAVLGIKLELGKISIEVLSSVEGIEVKIEL